MAGELSAADFARLIGSNTTYGRTANKERTRVWRRVMQLRWRRELDKVSSKGGAGRRCEWCRSHGDAPKRGWGDIVNSVVKPH